MLNMSERKFLSFLLKRRIEIEDEIENLSNASEQIDEVIESLYAKGGLVGR